jgi:type IV pilus assembly protein PilF
MMTTKAAAPLRRAALLVLLASPGLAQSPPDAELRFSTGVMHLREGRVDLALEEFKKAAQADPKNPYFQNGLGLAYSAKAARMPQGAARDEWKEAITAFRKAIELNPYYVDAKNALGYALIMSGDREGGKQEILSAFSDAMNPAPEISAYNLGRAYLEEKNYTEAANWFHASLNRNKAYSDAYLLLAETLQASGSVEAAVGELEVGVKEVPTDAGLQLGLGKAYFKVGRFSEARAKLEEALKLDPAGPTGRAAAEQLAALPK